MHSHQTAVWSDAIQRVEARIMSLETELVAALDARKRAEKEHELHWLESELTDMRTKLGKLAGFDDHVVDQESDIYPYVIM